MFSPRRFTSHLQSDTTRPVMHVVNSSLKIRGIQNPTVFFSQPKTQSYIVGGGYPSVTL